MKRIVIFLLLFFFLLFGTYLIAQQNDTSSYFPIGLWGVWIDKEKPPFTRDLLSIEWDREVSNWNSINGNFLVYWIPYWMQDDMLDFADNNGYKMDISNFYYWSTHPELPNSLHRWMYLTNPTETELISIINDIKTTYGAHPGFFNYTFGEETPVADPYYWPRVELISQKISELDPGRKSYMVSGGVPLEAFFNATPHLDILQVDVYTIWSPYEQKYSDQQYVFDQSLYHFSTTMDRIKDRHTEWHAIIQAQRDFRQTTPSCPNYLRRPNFYELRVQAFLAISRGARGITSFVYGSAGTTSPSPPLSYDPLPQQGLLMGNARGDCDIIGYAGLIDRDRFPYIAETDPDGIPAFQNLTNLHNELQPIGPTLRKLSFYDAFPNTSVPSGNCAGIVNVTGNKIEIGTFKRMDQGVDSSIYFIVVNRVCNNEDGSVSSPQNVNVSFNLNTVFTNWIVKEIGTSTSWVISKTGNFQTTYDPGDGKLFSLEPVMKVGGTLAYNESIPSGTSINIQGTVTVPSGKTLTLGEGCHLTLNNDVSLIVNGILSSVGTSNNKITFNRHGTSGHWGGIIFNTNSLMTISYCNIYHADYGIKCNNPFNGPNIHYCFISSCTYGIYATNYYGGTIADNTIYGNQTGIYLYNIPPYIANNAIIRNSSYGIYCDYYSNPYLYGNTISQNSTAVYCRINSSPHFTTPSNGHGDNTIRLSTNGLRAEYNSNAFLGSSSSGGYNVFQNNSDKHIRAYYGSCITAQYNYWGEYPPNPNKFYTYYGGWIDYSNALENPPFSKLSLIAKSTTNNGATLLNSPYSEELNKALNLELSGEYKQAMSIYKEIFEQELNTDIGRYCMVKINDCYVALKRTDFDEYVGNILSDKFENTDLAALRIELRNRGLMREEKFDKVLDNLTMLSSNENFSEVIRKNNMYNTALLYLNCYNNYSKAHELFTEFKSKYKDDRLCFDADLLIYLDSALAPKFSSPDKDLAGIDTQDKFTLLDNYPNPFNPSTKIKYSIPQNAKVQIKIFDILGKDVVTLVDEEKPAGAYELMWNAANLPSGVYFYQMTAGNFVKTKKMLLLK